MTRHIFVDCKSRLNSAFGSLQDENLLVIDALGDPTLKHARRYHCRRRELRSYDDMSGGIMQFFADQSGEQPSHYAELELDQNYFHRLDALEFTLQHDVSRRLDSIGDVDTFLVGLSRVSKTPISCYLASMGFKVANVSVAPEIGLPSELRRSMRKGSLL